MLAVFALEVVRVIIQPLHSLVISITIASIPASQPRGPFHRDNCIVTHCARLPHPSQTALNCTHHQRGVDDNWRKVIARPTIRPSITYNIHHVVATERGQCRIDTSAVYSSPSTQSRQDQDAYTSSVAHLYTAAYWRAARTKSDQSAGRFRIRHVGG